MEYSKKCSKCGKPSTVVAKEHLRLDPPPKGASPDVTHFIVLCDSCVEDGMETKEIANEE